MSAINVLQGGNLLPQVDTSNLVLDQVVRDATQRFTAEKQQIDQTTKQIFDDAAAKQERFVRVQASQNNAATAIENGLKGIDEVRTNIRQMRIDLGFARETPGSEEIEFRIDSYNDRIGALNRAADLYGKAFNPIGNVSPLTFEPNRIEYRLDQFGNTRGLTGAYVGSAFTIEDADTGNLWVPSMGSLSIQEYEVFAQNREAERRGEGSTSLKNGIRLDGFDEASNQITFTINANNEEPERTITGTLDRGGLGIMPAWFYNDFATVADVDRAISDIRGAELVLDRAEAQLRGNQAVLNTDRQQTENDLDVIRQDRSDRLQEQVEAQTDLSERVARELEATQRNIEQLKAQKDNYGLFYAPFVRSPFVDILT